MAKKVLFIDRDGTIIKEVPPTYQIDSFDKVHFYPGAFTWLGRIATEMDYELVMVTNQDGLGSSDFAEANFWPPHNFIMETFANEGINFDAVFIDKTYAKDNEPTRKPNPGMLTGYMNDQYNLAESFVIGDRITDAQLAKNLGCRAIWINENEALGATDATMDVAALRADTIAIETTDWEKIYLFLKNDLRVVENIRNTNETKIQIKLNADGTGKADISTGLHFFDHMLDQLARHGGMDLTIKTEGDLHIDEHHTIEDTAIALGEAFYKALSDKRGMERYGFCLPMDDCLAQVAIDFGGRSWLEWDATFTREKIGDMPTEMFYHFFKSFSDAAKCNLNIKASGNNEHHKIEAIFKAWAKAIKMAIKKDPFKNYLPSTKGVL